MGQIEQDMKIGNASFSLRTYLWFLAGLAFYLTVISWIFFSYWPSGAGIVKQLEGWIDPEFGATFFVWVLLFLASQIGLIIILVFQRPVRWSNIWFQAIFWGPIVAMFLGIQTLSPPATRYELILVLSWIGMIIEPLCKKPLCKSPRPLDFIAMLLGFTTLLGSLLSILCVSYFA